MSTPTPVMWRLGRSLLEEESMGDVAAVALAARERDVGMAPGQPFLLRPDGAADTDVLAFFTSSSFKMLSEQTQLSYAKDLRMFLSFLESQGRSWKVASSSDLLDFEYWRRRDPNNEHRVSGAKFSRELAACKKFFGWQHKRGVIPRDPAGNDIGPPGSTGSHSLRPRDARPVRVKWLTPRAFRQWRDVGLGGRLIDGTVDNSWRGRNDGRNVAFANLLWSSGLRLREAGTLLVRELPSPNTDAQFLRARLGNGVAKGRGRDFWVSAAARSQLDAYFVSTRAEAVSRARRSGVYEDLPGRQVVVGQNRSVLHLVDAKGRSRTISVDQLDWRERTNLFVQEEGGIAPAMLFLGDSGLPMHYESWEAVFATANRRCTQQGVPVTCYPHMLRHSFALRMLVTMLHAFDRRMGLTPDERRDYRMLFGDPWTLVQTLLGHTNPQTTRDIYLEPISGLQVDLFLNAEESTQAEQEFTDFVQRHLAATGLVNDGGGSP